MNFIKILDGENFLDRVKVREANLWMEPCTNRSDVEFWVENFKSRRIPYVLAQYDTELIKEDKTKMYRRVYGIFIDMKKWEQEHAQ